MPKARRSLPASYVVRLYRVDPARLDAVAGLVEDIAGGVTRSFRTGTELLQHLTDGGGEAGVRNRPARREHVLPGPAEGSGDPDAPS